MVAVRGAAEPVKLDDRCEASDLTSEVGRRDRCLGEVGRLPQAGDTYGYGVNVVSEGAKMNEGVVGFGVDDGDEALWSR